MADFSMYRQTVRCLGFRGVSGILLDRLVSLNNFYILQKSLSSVAAPNPHRMQLPISKIEEKDWHEILEQAYCLDIVSRREILSRARFFRNDFRNCYGVRSKTGSIAHIQWIVFPEENDAISAHYRRHFKPLEPNEIMLENAFTFPRFRGIGLLRYATRHLLNLAGELGYKKATAYVLFENCASLNELIPLGFSIRKVVREYRFLGLTRRRLEERRPGRNKGVAGQWNHSRGAGAETKTGPGAPAEGKGEHQHGFYGTRA
ncbi:MAG: hypothetical protein ACP5SH_02370 [Syntrophobacteraceae bacterium]